MKMGQKAASGLPVSTLGGMEAAMATNETDVVGHEGGDRLPDMPVRKAISNQVSMWVLTAWMILAPLLMLGTIWLLTIFRR